jgi:hypothetical protein
MGEVVYRSHVTVTRHRGPLRTATVPAEDRPLTFGVHGAVAEHYGTDPKDSEPHASLSHAQASPARLADLLRGHWGIETGLHWCRM